MKKRFYYYLLKLLASIVLFCSFGCTKDENVYLSELQSSLIKIENDVSLGLVKLSSVNREIYYNSFFLNLSEILKKKDLQNLEQELSDLYEHFCFKEGFVKSQKTGEELEITKEERIIFQSLVNSLKIKKDNPIGIADYYINTIPCLKVSDKIKRNCISKIRFYKDLLVFFHFDLFEKEDTNGKSENYILKKWNCLYRDCMDCCIYHHLKEVEDGNFVDAVWFIAKLPASLAKIFTSCGYDCIFLQ
mgnify:CR=1 FL=1